MTDPPRNVLEASGQVAGDVVSGLKNQPAMLTLVVLNVLGFAIAGWFLSNLIESGKQQREHMLQLIEKCLGQKTGGLPSKLADRLKPAAKE